MDWSHIETGWKEYQAAARNRWSRLTDELLAATHGKRKNLSSKVQEAYDLSPEVTEQQVADWQSRQKPTEQPQPAAKQ